MALYQATFGGEGYWYDESDLEPDVRVINGVRKNVGTRPKPGAVKLDKHGRPILFADEVDD